MMLYFIFVALQVILLHLHVSTSELSALQCGSAFRGQCLCGSTPKKKFLVNCTNTGFTNTTMLQNLPIETESLIFTGNNIPILPWNVFGDQDQTPHLKEVDMSNNAIKEIRGKAYHHVASVELLILDHNELSLSSLKTGEEVHRHSRMFSNFINLRALHLTNAFKDNSPANLANDLHDIFINSNLSVLIKLHLEQNELTGFADPMVFCDLPVLMDLHLGDNLLRNLHFNITCLHHLRFLDLRKNRITRLSKSDLATLDEFPARNQSLTIDLGGNPLCDCTDLLEWLKTTKVVVRNKDSLVCNSSPAVNGNTQEDAFQHVSCTTLHKISSPPSNAEAGTTTGVPGGMGRGASLLVVLLALAGVALILGLIYLKRIQFKTRRGLLDTVSRKVQYTTIGHHEEEVDV